MNGRDAFQWYGGIAAVREIREREETRRKMMTVSFFALLTALMIAAFLFPPYGYDAPIRVGWVFSVAIGATGLLGGHVRKISGSSPSRRLRRS